MKWWDRLKQARLDLAAKVGREIKKPEIAQKMGVSPVTVGYWEAGEREPNLDTFVKLAKVLDTTPEWIAFGAKPLVYTKVEKSEAATASASPASDARRAGKR